MPYDKPEKNQWIRPVPKGYKMACCDCGLVHDMDFKIEGKRVWFRVRRNQRSTGQIRRKMVKDGLIKYKE